MTQEQGQKIIARYGSEYIYRQLAEECAELTHAALKHVREMRSETPVRPEDVSAAFVEELADVGVMTDFAIKYLLTDADRAIMRRFICEKSARMVERLIGETDT